MLTPIDYSPRHQAIRDAMATASLDAMIVTNRSNVRYLTGLTGSSGLLAIAMNESILVTDGRYRDQARLEAEAAHVDVEIRIISDPVEMLSKWTPGFRRVGFEPSSLSVETFDRWVGTLGDCLVRAPAIIEQARRIKSAPEAQRILKAGLATTLALARVKDRLAAGASERQIARWIEDAMVDLGAEGPSFDTIVAAGPRAALPHARPTHDSIPVGASIVIDCGAVVDGYCSDMTRTFAVGEVDEQLTRVYDAVLLAYREASAQLRPGVAAAAVDQRARDVLGDAGLAEYFTHGTGHGVGLDIHEAPRLGSSSTDVVQAGDVVTVEPGVYIPGFGGVRIEDTLWVTEDGCTPLTDCPFGLSVSVLDGVTG